MNSKYGMFSVLVLCVMMLLIPASSLANAQEYEDRYSEDEQYEKIDKKSNNEQYKKKDDERKSYYNNDKEKSEPVIIIKNEPIVKKDKKKMKEPPMLLVKKDVLYCDSIAIGNGNNCGINPIPGPDSERYVQECTATIGQNGIICDRINEEFFDMIVTDDIEFLGSEEGTKLNFNGERYTVTEEEINLNKNNSPVCQNAGFENGIEVELESGFFAVICTVFEGECSGIIQDGELKECIVKNYVAEIIGT